MAAEVTLESGVVLALQGSGYPEVRGALKRHDQNLELGAVPDPRFGMRPCWKVYYRYGGEGHQVHFLCDWRDPDGTPRELSMGLVDKVKAQDRNLGESGPTAEDLNQKRQAAIDKHWENEKEALVDDFKRATVSAALPRTSNRGNHRWKEQQLQAQKRRRQRGLPY